VFEEIGARFRVTLSVLPQQPATLDERDRQIVELLKTGGGFSTQQIAGHLQLSPRATRARLRALVERGVIAEISSSPQDPRKQYVARQLGADE
jgi:predicted ArsR family transcriptional regulator